MSPTEPDRFLTMARDVADAWVEPAEIDLDEQAQRLASSVLKRALDIVLALAALLVLAPVLIATALAIVLESPGNPFFQQRRTGYRGSPFVIYKFRSMRVREDGETIVQAQRADSRITGVGAFIRRTSIDELPQLLNVLKGEMSLVGPRPHALAHDTYYGRCIAEYNLRFLARPGITGLAQVSGLRGQTEDVSLMAARVEKDVEYIGVWSLWLDVKILVKTLLIFAFHPAAY
ncbi:MAG TPA: exopolysaccharide biosynthesis polyprenyl glycosylphosphotransferase [Caulobacteraceae bacterium]|jgi:exopolysaccharide biosynthesis polyprenyl glycosylphosphotransferase|nr:exopolysaccharide biosynthesis polyprenyl glycosylphosphotransferase [Caulobacteraceae bacterium]